MNKKVALIIAHTGYQHKEYEVPKAALEEAGFDIITVSNKKGPAHAENNTTAQVDLLLENLNPLDYDGIIFIGGPGALENLDNDASYKIIQQAVMADKMVGAICIATRILAKSGALVTKTATGWNEDGELKSIFDSHGAIYTPESDVVRDGRIVTAQGPDYAEAFAHEIMEAL